MELIQNVMKEVKAVNVGKVVVATAILCSGIFPLSSIIYDTSTARHNETMRAIAKLQETTERTQKAAFAAQMLSQQEQASGKTKEKMVKKAN